MISLLTALVLSQSVLASGAERFDLQCRFADTQPVDQQSQKKCTATLSIDLNDELVSFDVQCKFPFIGVSNPGILERTPDGGLIVNPNGDHPGFGILIPRGLACQSDQFKVAAQIHLCQKADDETGERCIEPVNLPGVCQVKPNCS